METKSKQVVCVYILLGFPMLLLRGFVAKLSKGSGKPGEGMSLTASYHADHNSSNPKFDSLFYLLQLILSEVAW